MNNFAQQIAEEQRRQQEAIRAEQARIASDNAPRQIIAESQARLADLMAQQHQQTIEERIRAAREKARELTQMGQQLETALRRFDFSTAMALDEKITTVSRDLKAYNTQTLALAEPTFVQIWNDAKRQLRIEYDGSGIFNPEARIEGEATAKYNEAKARLTQQLPSTPDFRDMIRKWAQTSPEGQWLAKYISR